MKVLARRELLQATATVGFVTVLPHAIADEGVKVGILHSLIGAIALAEAWVGDAEKLAIDGISVAGSVLGKKINGVAVDAGASDWPTFAAKGRKPLACDSAVAVLGRGASASRESVRPVFEKAYRTYDKAPEQSPDIPYPVQGPTSPVGAAGNWLAANRGKDFHLIGSDDVWSRTANQIAKPTVAKHG